jgi:DUF971 family protein
MNLDAPHSVKYKKQSEALELIWADGSKSSISGQALRRYCAMGTSGIQVIFADGHDKGIYPWPYLQAIAANRAMELIN